CYRDLHTFPTRRSSDLNEKEVVERLLNNIAQMDYPAEKLEIQVLDDSTDESAELTKELVIRIKLLDLDIKYLSRNQRIDFKAGRSEEHTSELQSRENLV